MKIEKPGVYSVPAADYHADALCPDPSLSSSGARKIMQECPALYWYARNNPEPPSEAFKVGSAAHEWLLEGDTWPLRHYVLPDGYNAAYTKQQAEAIAAAKAAEARGMRLIKHEDFEAVKAMRDALAAHPFAMAAFKNGTAEQSLYWRDEEFGIWCRARPDFMPKRGNILTDYKTSAGVHPDDLRRSIFAYGYAQQAAWYMDGVRALGLIEQPNFLFVFQDKAPPHLIVPVTLDEAAVEWGRILNAKAKSIFARCLRSGEWPGYADDVLTLGLPHWAERDLQAKHDAGLFEIAREAQAPLGIEGEIAA